MSARKLGRFAGVVFVLAVVFGAVGAASIDSAPAGTVASVATGGSAMTQASDLIVEWD